MPTRDQVTRLVRDVEANRILDAIDEFYDENVSMQDNLNPPVVGKAANRERERAFFAGITVHQNRALSTAIDGDQVVIHWLFEFTRALGAPDEVITEATPNVAAVLSESFLYNLAHQRPWYEFQFGASLGIENQIPPAYIRAVEGFKHHYGHMLEPDDYAFHTIHIMVDEDHGGHVGEFAERYLDTDAKRRSARAAYFAGAEATRRCWDAYEGVSW